MSESLISDSELFEQCLYFKDKGIKISEVEECAKVPIATFGKTDLEVTVIIVFLIFLGIGLTVTACCFGELIRPKVNINSHNTTYKSKDQENETEAE